MNRGDAAAATWTFRGDESRRCRGCYVNIPWRRVAATPWLPREYSVETSRGDAAAATGDGRGRDVQIRSRPARLRYESYVLCIC